jgi:hypothetical protein
VGKSSLHDPENTEVSVPSAASVASRPSIIESLKSFFGVRKEVNEIKITVTPEEFLRKSWEVGKKKLHQIWTDDPKTEVPGNSGFIGAIACLRDLLTMISSNEKSAWKRKICTGW